MNTLTEKQLEELAKEKRREYHRKWREENRERINEYARKWREENPDKVKKYNENYWKRKALEELKDNKGAN